MNIQVKSVPREVYAQLRRAARRRGCTMRDVVLDALRRELSSEEFFARLAGRAPVDLGMPAARLVRGAREEGGTALSVRGGGRRW